MPELPDVTVYRERLEQLLVGDVLDQLRLRSAFVLRSVAPAPAVLEGATLRTVERLGKRLVFGFDRDLFAVLHLMIAGRLQWYPGERKLAGGIEVAALLFGRGTLVLTEAGSKKRASLHLVEGRAGLAGFDRGGLEVESATPEQFATRLRSENRTLKRALCDPTLFSGIGNAYSDEILHRARLSPVTLTSRLDDAQVARLRQAICAVFAEWTQRLRAEAAGGWPKKVTAFRDGMAVHGRYRQPCPVCGSPVQRVRYADSECNYCVTCQCEGRLLADRGLSQLLRKDWPKTLAELEERRRPGGDGG
ncbi:MAG: formamidopyrimidine-DNA glycosylase [Planctomycetes bacterium]|nr:formamidopyrimidine-DNA glycosylase [Planctomycetota bacterium]